MITTMTITNLRIETMARCLAKAFGHCYAAKWLQTHGYSLYDARRVFGMFRFRGNF